MTCDGYVDGELDAAALREFFGHQGALVYAMDYEPPKAQEVRYSTHVHISAGPVDAATLEKIKGVLRTCCDEGWRPHSASAALPSEPQVRSRSAAAKSPPSGLLTEQSGRYCGLGYCDEE